MNPADAGLQEAVLSVFDIDAMVRPMTEVGKYRRMDLPDASAGQFAAWQVPAACKRIEQALLVPPESTAGGGGCLRLVKFHGVPQRVMRSSQRSWDTGGIFDVDIFTTDVERVYRELQRHGWTALGEPVDYTEAHFSVRQVVAVGPGGFMLAMIQRFSPPVENLRPDTPMTAIFNSTQMVRDFDAAAQFYVDVLGWHRSLEFTIDNAAEPGADVLGLPLPQAKQARRRIGMFHPTEPGRGVVELIENADMHGREFGPHCVAPNVGLLCLRIPVPDARRYAAEIEGRGAKLYVAPQTLEVAPYGRLMTFSVRSPEGAMIEFFQRLPA